MTPLYGGGAPGNLRTPWGSFFMSQTGRRWTWTLNNYTSEEISHLQDLNDTHGIRYLLYGEEVGQEGTPHLQGYVEFCSTKRLSGVKSCLGDRIHAEVSRGTGTENYKYCTKTREEDEVPNTVVYEFGELRIRNQGRRTDLTEIKVAIEAGADDQEIASNYFGQWVRYRQSFSAYRTLLNRPQVVPNFQMESFPLQWQEMILDWSKTLIFCGDSGIGKTEFAMAVLPGALMVSHMDDLKNFDPSFHSGIIFDDVDVKHFPRTAQIHLVDITQDRSIHIRYSCAFIPKHTKKIFTTNELDGMCIDRSDPAIRRRTKVHNFVK